MTSVLDSIWQLNSKVGDYTRPAAEQSRLDALAQLDASFWSPSERILINSTKLCIIGEHGKPFLWRSASPKGQTICGWDCYRRATMLEPLLAEVLRDGVPGDVVEAGVYKGGISIALAAMLHARGELGEEHGRRRLYLADSFAGLPPSKEYSHAFKKERGSEHGAEPAHSVSYMAAGWATGHFRGSQLSVVANFARCMPSAWDAVPAHARTGPTTSSEESVLPIGVHMVPGFFNESLPGPLASRRIALLRADGDLYASIFETLVALYPLLSDGGYVVFDDWKFGPSRGAIGDYRQLHNVSSPIMTSSRDAAAPFRTLDRMAFWQKSPVTH